MDHITQLYQNRAKVLQEEVTRLEALLEAVVVPPRPKGRSLSALHAAEQADIAKQEAQAEAKAQADAAAEIKKTEDAKKAIEENPISGRLDYVYNQSKENFVNTTSPIIDVAKFAVNNKATTAGALLGLDLLAGMGMRTLQKLSGNKPTVSPMPVTTAAVSGVINKSLDKIYRDKQRAIEAEKIKIANSALAAEKAAKVAESLAMQNRAVDVYGEGLQDFTVGGRGQRYAYDPTQPPVIGRPLGKGEPKPSTVSGAFQAVKDILPQGEMPNPKIAERIYAKAYSYPAMVFDPDLWKANLEGAKYIAMTGKEVAGKLGKAATTPLPGSYSPVATGLAHVGAGLIGNLTGEYLVKPAAEKAGVFKAVESGTRSALTASPDWVAKVADPALGAAQTAIQFGLDPFGYAATAMGSGFEEKQRKEFEAMLKAGKPSAVRITPSMKM